MYKVVFSLTKRNVEFIFLLNGQLVILLLCGSPLPDPPPQGEGEKGDPTPQGEGEKGDR